MARPAKPWYWKARKGWYAYIDGQKTFLGVDRDSAERQFHQIMAKPPELRQPVDGGSVAAVLDDFLTWTEEHRAEKTYTRYKDFCQSFADECGKMPVSGINAGHVTAWLNKQKGWNSTTKRNAITALQRGFNWAVKNRGLDRNPIRGMEKPAAKIRTAVVTPKEFGEILAQVEDQAFRDLLIVSFDSGARPFEVKRLEARHVDLKKQRAIIPREEAKKGIPRAIYFPTKRSLDIIKRLVKEHPDGFLFLNNRGNPWTGFAVKNRFEHLQDKLGKRYRQYDLRHSFITRKLLAGVDSHLVAKLSGHRDSRMIDTVYSHVADDYQFMLQAAKKDMPQKKN